MDDVRRALGVVEKQDGQAFGDPANPLLVSVRSGAQFSMPGMMDTVLNLGLNEETLRGLAALTGNERFAQDAYRRFVQMFGKIVLDIPGDKFEAIIEAHKRRVGARVDTDLSAQDLREIARAFNDLIRRERSVEFPTDPWAQLELAIRAVFDSWMGKRAVDYRNFNKIPHDLGHRGQRADDGIREHGRRQRDRRRVHPQPVDRRAECCTASTCRTPRARTSSPGIRTPHPISQMSKEMPSVYAQFQKVAKMLERHYKDDAGPRVHGRTREAVDAADPQREADGPGRGQDRGRHGAGEADLQGRGAAARRAGPDLPAAAAAL